MRQECASKEWILVRLRNINFEGAKILVLLNQAQLFPFRSQLFHFRMNGGDSR